jgi:mono/diheme cytochrome c family protein
MAATDQTYRSQKTLDIVFAVSCVLMLISIVWMFVQDYNREFKHEQRAFRDVETALLERSMLERLPDASQLRAVTEAVAQARDNVDQVTKQNQAAVKAAKVKQAKAEAKAQGIKADYDSLVSLYNIDVENRDEAGTPALKQSLQAAVDKRKKQVDEKGAELAKAQRELEDAERELKQAQQPQKDAEAQLSKAEDRQKKFASEFDRFAKVTTEKKWKLGDAIRNLPVLDAFASPIKIHQFTMAEYPIDYSFKYVTRFDRCMTCHQGIDRPSFDKASLSRLTADNVPDGLQAKLDEARKELEGRAAKKKVVEGPGGKRRVLWPGEEKAADEKVVDTLPGEELGFDPDDLPKTVRTVKLSQGRVNEFCAHPRLDLFVEANSPHPSEKFGCTSCHSGQGSATDFGLAAHTPNNSAQKKEWSNKYDWESNHFWDYPMLPKRFIESTCLKCHHQVTDLVRYGSVEEAPKLLRGYNLLRESGCFGCHEISGIKGGREVGPDLRLEPSPALDAYTPNEQVKMKSDPLNPPGTMRKVGPSLYRLTEKTNQQWTRKWIEAPRNFRPTTKMPHFYGLSNNRNEVLPDDQKGFPEAEIASIAYYLFTESKDYLKGEDRFRRANQARIDEYLQKKKNFLASEQELKLLEELQRRMELDKKPVPLTEQTVVDYEGHSVQVPATQAGDPKEGRRLFTEKGCLACHQHTGTTKAGLGVPAVTSTADFAPDLSRLAAKLVPETGDAGAGRLWLIQWILDPKRHHPRTRMPVTYLSPQEAGNIAAWLLSQPVTDWDQKDVPNPSPELLANLARVYLLKAPGMTRQDVDDILSGAANNRRGLPDVKNLPLDSDERELAGPLTDDKLKWYVGRKAITRLGCFGCHEVPGFATAKPIGTPLNDWGKKDPERLAFEDIVAYVKEHYHITDQVTDENGRSLAAEQGQKPPYEKFFFDALDHRQREGFLHQKLKEPRSYDFHLEQTWDSRLRMPQFQFARGHIQPKEGESYEQAKAREEAEAREAVMTFVLGLVAEPVPNKYLNEPPPDRLAEIKGRQVLEKFNCIGCHQARAGVYQIVKNDDTEAGTALTGRLDQAYDRYVTNGLPGDHPFPEDNAWTGLASPVADRLFVYGLPVPPPADDIEVYTRLTQALRYTKTSKEQAQSRELQNIPAGEYLELTKKDIISRSEPYGGVFANLMIHSRYMTQLDSNTYPTLPNGESPESRKVWPPPLLREGEKTQPGWLFQFLRNPTKLRPVVRLRMPRFNMSDDDAMELVNYFAAVDRLNNPGIGLSSPYLPPMPQHEEAFWHLQSQQYVKRLKEAKQEQGRLTALKPLWDLDYTERLAQAQAALKAVQVVEGKEPDPAQKKAAAELAALKDKAAFDKAQAALWEDREAYASDGYRLVANYQRCLNCHPVGPQDPTQAIGPPLELAATRLRPDWTQRWIASPQRLLIYPFGSHPMPTNFARNSKPWSDFDGSMLEQATAVRDVLINYPKVAEMPVNRLYRSAPGETKK